MIITEETKAELLKDIAAASADEKTLYALYNDKVLPLVLRACADCSLRLLDRGVLYAFETLPPMISIPAPGTEGSVRLSSLELLAQLHTMITQGSPEEAAAARDMMQKVRPVIDILDCLTGINLSRLSDTLEKNKASYPGIPNNPRPVENAGGPGHAQNKG